MGPIQGITIIFGRRRRRFKLVSKQVRWLIPTQALGFLQKTPQAPQFCYGQLIRIKNGDLRPPKMIDRDASKGWNGLEKINNNKWRGIHLLFLVFLTRIPRKVFVSSNT